MSRISPKLIDVERNRVGDYVETRKESSNQTDRVYMLSKEIKPSYMTGRFPTQLFTNIKNDKFKYVKNINI